MTTAAPAVIGKPLPRSRAWTAGGRRPTVRSQILLQVICLFITATVLFPILWIFSLALDPRNLSRPTGLIPPGATLDAFARVIAQPTSDPISFIELARNSFVLASGVALFSVLIGVLAAYAFSRLRFRLREVLMIAILGVLMLPAVATIAPLFIMLNSVRIDLPILGQFNLRQSLLGVGLAVVSGALPFAIWNLKGYLDTIPKELEEAAVVDGAGKFQTFLHVVLPLATPVLAVTALFGFIAGWTEFLLAQVFIVGDPSQWTLAVALNALVGQYAGSTPWSTFAAFAVLFALPVMVVYLLLQRWIVSGLTVGGVKG